MPLISLPKLSDWTLASGLETIEGIGIRLVLDPYTKLLLHCNGADGSTSFPDSSGTSKEVTANGSTQVDTAQSVFGGVSALFDGTGDYLTVPDHDDWHFAAGDFTVDFRVRFNVVGNALFLQQRYQCASSYGWQFYRGGGNLIFQFTTNGGNEQGISVPWNPSANTWYHLSAVRNGTSLTLYADGVQLGSSYNIGSASLYNASSCLTIGGGYGGYELNGWMDEIRVSKGVARWTADFTPPTQEYTTYAPDSPAAESPWIAIDENTLDGAAAINILENKIAALQGITNAGNAKYQYALNNGAYNGTWLTHAQLLSALIGTAIANHVNSLRLKAQFNSDGTQAVDISGFGAYVQASGITGGGGGTRSRYAEAIGVKGGFR